MSDQINDSGIKLNVIEASVDDLSRNSTRKKVTIYPTEEMPCLEYVSLDVSEQVEKLGLCEYNVRAILNSLDRGKIPLLVDNGGCGKTYTCSKMAGIIKKHLNWRGEIKQFQIVCCGVSRNDFWHSYDMILNECIGPFLYLWDSATKNVDTLYYVNLDELIDMDDIRLTFSDSFALLPNKPKNLIVVATGCPTSSANGGGGWTRYLNDAEVQKRFDTIWIKSILDDNFDSFMARLDCNVCFDVVSFIRAYRDKYNDLTLSPMRVTSFVGGCESFETVDDFIELMSLSFELNENYIVNELFCYSNIKSGGLDEFLDIMNSVL